MESTEMMETDYEYQVFIPDDSLGYCLARLASGRLPEDLRQPLLSRAWELEEEQVKCVTHLWDRGCGIEGISNLWGMHPIYVEKLLRSAQRIGIYAQKS